MPYFLALAELRGPPTARRKRDTAMHHDATAEGAKSAPTDEELIASAMKAAPKKVAENATIVAPSQRWDAYAAQGNQWLYVHA